MATREPFGSIFKVQDLSRRLKPWVPMIFLAPRPKRDVEWRGGEALKTSTSWQAARIWALKMPIFVNQNVSECVLILGNLLFSRGLETCQARPLSRREHALKIPWV